MNPPQTPQFKPGDRVMHKSILWKGTLAEASEQNGAIVASVCARIDEEVRWAIVPIADLYKVL